MSVSVDMRSVKALSFAQAHAIAVELLSWEHSTDAQDWAQETDSKDYGWVFDVVCDWADGKITYMNERFMHITIQRFGVAQCIYARYERYMARCESAAIDAALLDTQTACESAVFDAMFWDEEARLAAQAAYESAAIDNALLDAQARLAALDAAKERMCKQTPTQRKKAAARKAAAMRGPKVFVQTEIKKRSRK